MTKEKNGNAFLSDRENEIERISKMHLEIEMKKAMNIVTREDMLYTSYACDAAKARLALSCIDTIYTISSFTHEFGHLIDHQMGDLSEQAAFSSVIKKYREYLETQEKPELLSSKYNRYLLTPQRFLRDPLSYMLRSRCV